MCGYWGLQTASFTHEKDGQAMNYSEHFLIPDEKQA